MNFNFDNVKVETYIPKQYVDNLRNHLNDIGALTIGGNYDNCISVSETTGYWRPLEGSNPFEGTIGEICKSKECKLEFCCCKELIQKVLIEIKENHPYEEPVINIIPIINPQF